MKIVYVKGGLGNQMFQYAFAKLIQKHTRDIVKIDMSRYDLTKDDIIRQPRLLKFNIDLDIATTEEINSIKSISRLLRIKPSKKSQLIEGIFNNRYYFERGLSYKNVNDLLRYDYYDGYWQSFCYVDEVFEDIRSDFIPKYKVSASTNRMIDRVKSEESVFVGIRRGDYTNNEKLYGSFSNKYYMNAMEYISKYRKNPIFYIFSNDINWVKYNMNFGKYNVVYREKNEAVDDFEDFLIMCSCQDSIIVNSTFHWWAARMTYSSKKIVIAPTKWFFDNTSIDIIPRDWIRIEDR